MPSVDENSNTTTLNGHDAPDEPMGTKQCDCCPFGYHIDRDFVPFSRKMLYREGDVQKVQALKDKWRSKRQSMDKLLGIETESEQWEVKTLSRPNRDVWEFDSKVRSLHDKLAASVPPLQVNDFESLDFTFGAELDQAVEEFEEVLARAKPEFNSTLFTFPDEQKFHTFPRQKPANHDLSGKSRIPLLVTSAGVTIRHRSNREERTTTATSFSGENGSTVSEYEEKRWSNGNVDSGRLRLLEDQLKLMPQLEESLTALRLQNQEYLELWEIEKKRRIEVEEEMNSVINGSLRLLESETTERKISTGRKRTRDVAIGVGVTTRDVGVSHIQSTMRSIGVGGRIDTTSLDRESSPTGSVNGRGRRTRTFETGIQVNEAELLDKDPPPPLLVTEKCDIGFQVDIGEILTSKFGFEPSIPLETDLHRANNVRKTITKSVGINVKPIMTDCGIYFRPTTREGMTNTIGPETRNKSIGTVPQLYHKDSSGDESLANKLSSTIDPKHVSTIGVNTVCPELSSVASNTLTLLDKQSNSVQTERVGTHEVGIQMSAVGNVDGLYTTSVSVPLTSKSVESYNRPSQQYPLHRSTNLEHLTSDLDSPLSPPIRPAKPPLLRSNTYNKDEEFPIDDSQDEFLEGGVSRFEPPKYFRSASFDLSIPTIPERREAVKPSKEMQGALKVLNDALLRGKTTEHVTSAIGIILHEWFRVSGSKSANAHDVEDYLDLFENYSPELLKYIVNMPDGNGNSAIHYAVSHGNFDVVSVLLDSNCCDINRANKAGYTCIMLLSLAKLSFDTDRHVVCRLCGLGDVNIKATQHGQTALMLAASHGRLETCKILLDAGADINIRDDDGSTALMCAAEHGHGELVNYFVTLPDCDLHSVDNDGSTALNVAMEANHKDIGVTLYAHMHLVESPKVQHRRLSYPPGSPPASNRTTPSPTSAGNSPGTKKKLRENIQNNQAKGKVFGLGDATESA